LWCWKKELILSRTGNQFSFRFGIPSDLIVPDTFATCKPAGLLPIFVMAAIAALVISSASFAVRNTAVFSPVS
jgi:hypothetical protein